MMQFKGWETLDSILDFLVSERWGNDVFIVLCNKDFMSDFKRFFDEFHNGETDYLQQHNHSRNCYSIIYGSFKIDFVQI